MSASLLIMKFKFHETFTVDFVVEAETYEKAHAKTTVPFAKSYTERYYHRLKRDCFQELTLTIRANCNDIFSLRI